VKTINFKQINTMKTIQYFFLFILAGGLMLFQSCTDDGVQDRTGVMIHFASSSSPAMKSAVTKSTAVSDIDTVIFTEAMIGVEKIKFRPLGEEDDDDVEKIVFVGPYAVNLLTGDTDPAINWVDVEPGLYKEIELETDNYLEGDKAVIIKGVITFADHTEKSFELIAGDDFEIEVENDNGFTINEGVINPAFPKHLTSLA
jgi:hypothetical protein